MLTHDYNVVGLFTHAAGDEDMENRLPLGHAINMADAIDEAHKPKPIELEIAELDSLATKALADAVRSTKNQPLYA